MFSKTSPLWSALEQEAELPTGMLLFPTHRDPLPRYFKEWRDRFEGVLCPVVRPQTTLQVSKIMAFCAHHTVQVIPQGGNTGLVGGQIPLKHSAHPQLLISLEHMKTIRALDPLNNTAVVEAGVVLETLQNEAEAVGRLFPLDLASRGTAQIGGLIATNAGGIAVMRYGQMRSLVLGLEVVLWDGHIWNGLRTVRKDNMGYDLKQLFIGSEGTLGLITAATLRLFPAVKTVSAGVAVQTPHDALSLLRHLEQDLGASLTAFEIMPRIGLDMVLRHKAGTRLPFDRIPPWMIVLEASFPPLLGDSAGMALLTQSLENAFEQGNVDDIVIAQNQGQSHALWDLRESLSEAQKHEGASIKHDISVPISDLPAFIQHINTGAQALIPHVRPVPFGHFADGNLHYNFTQPLDMDKEVFLEKRAALEAFVHSETIRWGGSIAAEHGIGQAKYTDQKQFKSPLEYQMMQNIKQTFDPLGILNTGKVISAEA